MTLSRKLPPLKSIVVFEQCSRYFSFSRAADELGITQSAVSRHISILEASIETRLFNRSKQGVTLTTAGELYAEDVSRFMTDLIASTERLRSWVGPRQVTIAASTAVADMWLSPRLQRLEQAFPGLELRIHCENNFERLSFDEFDFAIFFQASPRTDVKCVELGREELIPVSAPGSAPLMEQRDPVLISIDGAMRDWTDWADWFQDAGLMPPDRVRRWRLGEYRMVIDAAAKGLGTAIGWTWLIADMLAEGRLVPVHDHVFRARGSFYLMYPAHRHQRKIARAVAEWLIDSNRDASA